MFPKHDENDKIVAPFVTSKIENAPDKFNSVTRQYQFENPKNGLNLVVYLKHFFPSYSDEHIQCQAIYVWRDGGR